MFLLFKRLRFLQMKFGFWFNFIVFLNIKNKKQNCLLRIYSCNYLLVSLKITRDTKEIKRKYVALTFAR